MNPITKETLACQGKHKHLTRSAASIELKRVNKNRYRQGQLNVYKCPYCDHFHIGRSGIKYEAK